MEANTEIRDQSGNFSPETRQQARLRHARSCAPWLGLGLIESFFLAISWRKWPDPLIDFGCELYTPWRLSQGALLYRDVDHFFGAWSPYLNAAVFRLFGPGMMVLATLNLIVFNLIIAFTWVLFRRAWGSGAAFFSAAIFISVFGFAQYVENGNYNYVTPYSHESTQGMLLCLLLLFALLRWIRAPRVLPSLGCGLLLGITALLKIEFIMAGALLTLAAAAIRLRQTRRIPWQSVGIWALGTILPTVAFAVFFRLSVPWSQAFAYAGHAWLSGAAIFRGIAPLELQFLGLGRPVHNVAVETVDALGAALLLAGVGTLAWQSERNAARWNRWGALILAVVLLGLISLLLVDWRNAGRSLTGLVLIYLLVRGICLVRRPVSEESITRFMIALLAAAMIARMLLNSRIFHYGFYQAVLAAILVPAVLIGEVPGWLKLGPWGKKVVVAGTLTLFLPGIAILVNISWDLLSAKTEIIGRGADRFYIFPAEIELTGENVRQVIEWLGTKAQPNETVLVLPEGEMINYQTRLPNPVAPFAFYSAVDDGTEDRTMVSLLRDPPDWVVLVSRDLREYGIERYGEAPGRGQYILGWVVANYDPVYTTGSSPFNLNQSGAIVFHRHPGKRENATDTPARSSQAR